MLVVATQSDLDLTRYCFRCHSHWAGRLRTGGRANWATQVPGRDFRSDEESIQTVTTVRDFTQVPLGKK